MLVLSREAAGGKSPAPDGSVIAIGHDITITVIECRGNKVRLGIDAPKEVPVHRMEVKRAIEQERNRTDGG